MNHLPLATVTILIGAVACAGSMPTPPSAVSLPELSPNAIRIALGETINGVVKSSDPDCDRSYQTQEPCQQFVITISTAGILTVRVASPGPGTLALQV